MRIDKLWVGAVMVMFALAGCGSDDAKSGEQPAISSGTGAVGAAGMTPAQTAGTGTRPTAGTGGAAPMAGRAAAGSGTTGGSGTGATAAGTGATSAGTGATAAAGSSGSSGSAAGSGQAGSMPMAGTMAPAAGTGSPTSMGKGMCCASGDCLCHGDPPSAPTNMPGPFKTAMYDIPSAGCVHYPMDAEPPFAAVTISDGFGGSGGCGPSQTGQWGPLYASWGIVAMIIHTGAGDQPQQRGQKLSAGVEAFKMENMKMGSPLMGKLSGRYGTSGFSMGGGGTTFSAMKDPMLKSNVSIMAWTPATSGIMVPSLFIFGSSDTLAGTMGMSSYRSIADSVPKMAVTVNSGHAGQPSSGGGASGKAGLAFQKVYLEGDERWKPILLMIDATDTNIK
jgi:hypothetical protein